MPRKLQLVILLIVLIGLAGQRATVQAQISDRVAPYREQVDRAFKQGRLGDALPAAEQWAAIATASASRGLDYGSAMGTLANVYRHLGRYAEAEPLYLQQLRIAEHYDRLSIARAQSGLATLYLTQGRLKEAEPLYRAALYNTQKALGDNPPTGFFMERKEAPNDPPEVGAALINLADLYRDQGRHAEAHPLYLRAIAIYEGALERNHSWVAPGLNGLGELHRARGRYEEARGFHERALRIEEKVWGGEHPFLTAALNDLARLYRDEGRYHEARALHRRALSNAEKALGPDHLRVGETVAALAELYHAQGRPQEAELLYGRALGILEKAAGPNLTGRVLSRLGRLLRELDRHAEAEPLLHRGLGLLEKALGSRHPHVEDVHSDLAKLYLAKGDLARAAGSLRHGTSIAVWRTRNGIDDIGRVVVPSKKLPAPRAEFDALVKVAHRLASGSGDGPALLRESFLMAQWASIPEAATSLQHMAARLASRVDGTHIEYWLRRRQDLIAERRALERARVADYASMRDKRAIGASELFRLHRIDQAIAEIERSKLGHLGEYRELAGPKALSVEEVQSQLGPDEALVLMLETPAWQSLPEETFIWTITKADNRWVRSDLGPQLIAAHVDALRCGLDARLWDDANDWPETTEEEVQRRKAQIARRQRCVALLKAEPVRELVGGIAPVQVLPFDLGRAHELYHALFGRVEDMIKGKRLIIVPSGPLTSLPFNVLVTSSPQNAIPDKLADYREAAWLDARQPISILPAVFSLKALRGDASASRASRRYLGIGNPLLDGRRKDSVKNAEKAKEWHQCQSLSSGAAANGPLAQQSVWPTSSKWQQTSGKSFNALLESIENVRQLEPLPDTGRELCEIAARLGVPPSDVLQGARATETTLKDLSGQGRLTDYAIIHFATHGALAGEVTGFAEPGLILTPPAKGTADRKLLERDDGFLTLSEIADLKLDADWVILSACDTAGEGEETTEPLSGIAQAFFHAGARSLLVSHWYVDDVAATELTTRAIAHLESSPGPGRAEALRRSMRELRQKCTSCAHPSMWAPFVLVGAEAK